MNELVKVNYESSRPTVLGRDLHKALGVETPYSKWFPRMAEYGFTEGIDYMNLDKNVRVQNEGGREVAREVTDHQLTIPMAKELCMLQRTEKGKECRRYFISIEEAWNNPQTLMARALQAADSQIKQLTAQVQADAPKVLFANAVTVSDNAILIGELAKILKGNGIDMGQNRLFERLRNDGFLIKRNGTDYNMPTQRSMELGLFKVKETAITHSDGHVTINKTAKVTGKGQTYFVNRYLGNKPTA